MSPGLPSVIEVAGLFDGPGKGDILSNTKQCAIVFPGIASEVMKRMTSVAGHARMRNLYIADLLMLSFTLPGQGALARRCRLTVLDF